MANTTSISTNNDSSVLPGSAANGKTKLISWPDFQKKYLLREDGFKYEWVNGEVVKSKNMDYSQLFIVKNLLAFFRQLVTTAGAKGELLPEIDIFFNENHRRPDISYFTDEQVIRTSYKENQVPEFVIEIISTKDQMNLVHEKMENYREAGVKIVWHIFPNLLQVHVFQGEKLENMRVNKAEDLCTASPVIPGFEMAVNDILHREPKPA